MGPFPGFQGALSTVWGNGALLCPSGAVVGNCVGKSRRSVPARALRAAMGPFPGFQGAFLRFGAIGRFYAPLGQLWESRGEVPAQDARQGSQSGNGALSGVSGHLFYGLGQLGVSMPLWGVCGAAALRRTAGWPRRGSSGVAAGVCLAAPAALGEAGAAGPPVRVSGGPAS